MADDKGRSERLKVAVRIRPLSERERVSGSDPTFEATDNAVAILIPERNPGPMPFDGVYGEHSSTVDLYEGMVQPVVDQFAQGDNGTVLAYGCVPGSVGAAGLRESSIACSTFVSLAVS
jgi:hypothetical protein